MLSLVGLGLPLASKGDFGVSILMLANYYLLSYSNAMPLVLALLAPLAVGLAIRAAVRGASENLDLWCVAIGLSGLSISSLGYFEGVQHIRIFGSGCMPQTPENNPLAQPGIGSGTVLHMVAYAAMTAWGMRNVLRPPSERGQCMESDESCHK